MYHPVAIDQRPWCSEIYQSGGGFLQVCDWRAMDPCRPVIKIEGLGFRPIPDP